MSSWALQRKLAAVEIESFHGVHGRSQHLVAVEVLLKYTALPRGYLYLLGSSGPMLGTTIDKWTCFVSGSDFYLDA